MRSAQSTRRFTALSAIAALLACPEPAEALLTYNIYEDSGNVIIETQGSLNLPAPSTIYVLACGSSSGLAWGSLAVICTGTNLGIPLYDITGPTTLMGGPSSIFFGTSTSGMTTTLYGGGSQFTIDSYTSGDPIVASTTFNGQTLASMGFTTLGTIGTWSVTGTGDTIKVNVGNPVSSVPGPLPLLGAATALGFSRRLRRRIEHRQS